MRKGSVKAKSIVFITVFLLIFSSIYLISSWDSTLGRLGIMKPFGRDYQLTGAESNIRIASDGTMYVHEEINYLFKGRYREVYREPEISRKKGNGPYISHVNASCDPKCNVIDRSYEIAGNFGSIKDRDASFTLDYEIKDALQQGSDVTTLHYKIWGEQWDKPVRELHGTIELPAEPLDVYFNPLGTVEYTVEGNTVQYSTGTLGHYMEIWIVMTPEAVTGNTLPTSDSRASIALEESKYKATYYTYFALTIAIAIAMLIFIVAMPAYLFRKYGKEPEIGYDAIYEREPVKGIKPYIINSLVMGRTGDTDRNAITATLLDLIRRKHIRLEEITAKKKILSKKEKDLVLTFEMNPKDQLSPPEQLLFDYFTRDSKRLIWSGFIESLKTRAEARAFIRFTKNFEKSVDNEYLLSEYFETRGNTLWKRFCTVLLILSAVLTFYSIGNADYHFISGFRILFVFGIAYSIAGLLFPMKVFGRFTPKGYGVYRKSLNYRKFMTDMTLLKKYPPASIVIWEEVLVYATLFGVAKKVMKQLKVVFPDAQASHSSLYPLYSAHTFSSFSSANAVASSTLSSSSGSGGFGGGSVGGGFGGGGGGAR